MATALPPFVRASDLLSVSFYLVKNLMAYVKQLYQHTVHHIYWMD
jgi:hypothetical protein